MIFCRCPSGTRAVRLAADTKSIAETRDRRPTRDNNRRARRERGSEATLEHADVVHDAAPDRVVGKVREVGLEHHEPVAGPVGHHVRAQETGGRLVDGHEVVGHERLGRVPPVHLGLRLVPEEHRGAAVRAQNHLGDRVEKTVQNTYLL